MSKGTIKTKDIRLICPSLNSIFIDGYLFLDIDGFAVHSGDTVEFYIKGNIFPNYGKVSNHSGLRIECFNTILNQRECYKLEN